MARLKPADRWLLLLLLPAALLVIALHVREALGPGALAEPPIFAAPAPSEDGYPTVGGLRLERGLDWAGLEPGDKLLQIGERDLRGVGYFGFDVIALAEAGSDHEARIVYEREGQTRELVLRMLQHPLPWYRLPGVVALLAVAIWVLFRSRGTQDARLFFATFFVFSIFMLPLQSPTPWLTWLHLLIFNVGGSIAFALILLWAISFPPGLARADRISPWWASLGLLHGIVRMAYWLPGPPDRTWVPNLTLGCDLFFIVMSIGIIARNHSYLDPVARRRVKWVLLALTGWTGLMGVAAFAGTVSTDILGVDFPLLVVISGLSALMLPLALGISVVRYNLFDINRALSATAAFSLALVVAVLAAIALSNQVGQPLAALTGLSRAAAQSLVLVVVSCIAVPIGMKMQPRLDRLFFPDRAASMSEANQLLQDLPLCRTPQEVFDLLGQRLHAVFRAEDSGIFVAEGDAYRCSDRNHEVAATDGFALALERNPIPLRVDPADAKAAQPLAPGTRRTLEALDAEVVVPVRCGQSLMGFVLLGPKRNGDIYSQSEMASLSALATAASAELLRMRDAGLVESARSHASEMTRLREAADRANEAKSKLLAAISHDLRQPVHAIGLLLEALDEDASAQSREGAVERIRSATLVLNEMIESLLELSRIDAGTLRAKIDDVDLDAVLLGIVAEFEPIASQQGLELRLETTGLRVRTDRLLLGRMIRNLVSNALRYTEKGRVSITADTSTERVAIHVRDTGAGIPAEQQARIFDEFVRLDAGGEGLGLGLSIVKGLATLLDHELELESEVGRGTRFTVHLPAAPTAPHPPQSRPATAALPLPQDRPFEGHHVLVVDDDLRVLDATRRTLQAWGANVMLAASLEDIAASLAASNRPLDLIIADYNLAPAITGLEAIEEVRAILGTAPPAIVMTAETSADVLEAIAAAGHPVLAKPVKPARLRATLQAQLSRAG